MEATRAAVLRTVIMSWKLLGQSLRVCVATWVAVEYISEHAACKGILNESGFRIVEDESKVQII